eukprot:4335936-Karenia_brevis.AAC.1
MYWKGLLKCMWEDLDNVLGRTLKMYPDDVENLFGWTPQITPKVTYDDIGLCALFKSLRACPGRGS